jgi:hypothetical protein
MTTCCGQNEMTELANLVALSMKVQGLGAGGMLSLVQVIVTDIVSMREREIHCNDCIFLGLGYDHWRRSSFQTSTSSSVARAHSATIKTDVARVADPGWRSHR